MSRSQMTENKGKDGSRSDNVVYDYCPIVTHEEIVRSLREFADYLESLDPRNRPSGYGIGGRQEHMFLDWRLWIRAEVTNPKQWLSGELGRVAYIPDDMPQENVMQHSPVSPISPSDANLAPADAILGDDEK